jgi:hypothetical protein
MDLDKKLKEVFRTQDKNYKDYMSITETDWHYDGDGKTVEMVGETGVLIPRNTMGRIVEYLREVKDETLGPPKQMREFTVDLRLDVKTLGDGDRREIIGNTPFIYIGDIDHPADYYSQEARQRFPKAWDSFKAHRGLIFHSGQWIKSMYVAYLEEQEKTNGGNKTSGKSSGSH